MTKTKTKEIGEQHDVKTRRRDYRVHVRGNPAEEALLIEKMTKEGKTQTEIGKALSLSQPQISKRRLLLKLLPALFEKLRSGELLPTAGYMLAKMDESIQKEYNGEDKVTVRAVESKRREILVSSELTALLVKKIDVDPPRDHTAKSLYRITIDMSCPWIQHDPPFDPKEVGDWLVKEIKRNTEKVKVVDAGWAP
ncbi:MAG TPA: hypothetical protein VGS11_10900 [Candidatus Bathyarchaeia archaeon]|nr:hypothetical protein [Candidatus Bathyarchaeia archaeon]